MKWKKVFDIGYMRYIRFALDTLAQWPNRSFHDESRRARFLVGYRVALIILTVLLTANCIWYSVKHKETLEFIDMGQIYTNIFMNCLFLQRSILPFQSKYCNTVEKFCSEFHLIHHQHRGDFATQIHFKVDKLCRIATKIIHIQLCLGILSYNFVPFFRNINAGMLSAHVPENKTFQHSVYYVLPFDAYSDRRGYLALFAFNFYPSYNIPSAMCYYDLFIFVLVFHISGHLDILSHSLKCFPREKRAGKEYNEEVFALLKGVIRHYEIIKEFMNEMSEAFDLTISFYLAFHQVMWCLMLLECSSLEPAALGKYGVLALFIFQQLIQTSVVFEIIRSKSDNLGDKVYELPWELMDNKNRKILLLFLKNVQSPLSLKACGVVPVGVLTMSTIIRTSFSYYLMLATLAD